MAVWSQNPKVGGEIFVQIDCIKREEKQGILDLYLYSRANEFSYTICYFGHVNLYSRNRVCSSGEDELPPGT